MYGGVGNKWSACAAFQWQRWIFVDLDYLLRFAYFSYRHVATAFLYELGGGHAVCQCRNNW